MSAALGGWEISGIATARTGMPVNIQLSRPTSALPDGNNSSQRDQSGPGRADLRGEPNYRQLVQSGGVCNPGSGHLGQPRTVCTRGPGYSEFDTALQKKFRLTERTRLNFRAEVFNLFNQAIYANPGGNLGSTPRARRRVSDALPPFSISVL